MPDICIDHGPLATLCLACLEKNINLRLVNQALRIQHRLKEFYGFIPPSADRPILFPVSVQAILAMVQEFIDEPNKEAEEKKKADA